MPKAMYFRVGMDTGVGRSKNAISPVFSDGTFEFIPIPDLVTSETYTYETCAGKRDRDKCFSEYLPEKLHKCRLHYDPDFSGRDVPVYCDGTTQKEQFLSLAHGDLLAFYAGLRCWNKGKFEGSLALYFTGFIVVDKVVSVNAENVLNQPSNAHTKRYEYIVGLGNSVAKLLDMNMDELAERSRLRSMNGRTEIPRKLCKKVQEYALSRNLTKNLLGYSNIEALDKRVREAIARILHATTQNADVWEDFLGRFSKDEMLDFYSHLTHAFSTFTLVKGNTESRLLKKALRISDEDEKVLKEYHRILGVPEKLDLTRKRPRFVPNKKYQNGDYEGLRRILLSN